MALTIRTLRVALVVLVVALVGVIAGYVGYARLRGRNYLKGLPAKYGLDITSDNVSFSHAIGADTEFTLRAARQVQRQDGKITLHDVGIVLYGRKADRSDRIHGAEFEYDPKGGVLHAVGDVYIDLAAPAVESDKGALKGKAVAAPATPMKAADESRMIHVKTSGLMFVEKERSATTEAPVEFRAAGMTGNSVGASYDAGTGVVVLRSAVRLSGLRNERPIAVTASRAELDKDGSLVKLESARATLTSDGGTRTVTGDRALLHMNADGSPERVDAQGHVTLTGEGRRADTKAGTGPEMGMGTVSAERLEVELNQAGQPSAATMAGGVRYRNSDVRRQEDGSAQQVHVAFDGQGRPVHALLTGNVVMDVHEGKSERRLDAPRVDLDLGGGGKDRVFVRGAVAAGGDGARLRLTDVGKDGATTTVNGMHANVLTARFSQATVGAALAGKKRMASGLAGLDGTGNTFLEQVVTDSKGALESKETSTGETLRVDFRDGVDGKTEVTRAEQRGSVSLVRELKAKASAKKGGANTAAEIEHVTADVAVYDKLSDRLTMSGGVRVQNAESALFADRVEADRKSGDSTAEGLVRVSYLQAGSTREPLHVLAGRAISRKATGLTEFVPGPGGLAKMWQGGSQVMAPVLDFDREQRVLTARGNGGSDAAEVQTVIEDAKSQEQGAAKKRGNGGPMRVASEEMVYTDATRQAEFKGRVRLDDANGVLRAHDAIVYLAPAAGGTAGKGAVAAAATRVPASLTLGGRVDHMVATGAVLLEQPGRRAMGERLTYTAGDQVFVLTGTKAAPPKVVDATRGTVTGASLRFRSGDDSVVIASGQDADRVRSETRMKQ